MARSGKTFGKNPGGHRVPEPVTTVSQVHRMNRLKDDVYREMLLVETNRPGAEMGLALALLRAIAQSPTFADDSEFADWLKIVCPLGLRMIEEALGEPQKCKLDAT